ncbi:hypothetical protein AMJ40_06450 [candidate division TA06 bacterium DG_26]|uniref:FlgD/Vpr Ig-like domain-containing protein n=1 Tax=candidate division TA06 bacterium DG_26 TaxID=1703771 RepID=A0A0S7WFV7_UNCT6|nr:MAG: hypothetical protein AMJ40_06450 [candidate division TA06 bacterium DG_26]
MQRVAVLTGTVIAMLSLFGTASSTIWHVHPDSAISAIQAGIDSSSSGDTVLVYPATYVENINFDGKNIILGSLFLITGDMSYISSTVIDGDSSGPVVVFENGEDHTAIITGFTIRNGRSEYGGGIYCDSSSPSLSDLVVSENAASSIAASGGGIYCYGSSPRLINVTVSQNAAYGELTAAGGGIYFDSSNANLTNVTVSGNSAYGDVASGGGISCGMNSSLSLTDCIINGNSAHRLTVWSGGGGIRCGLGSSLSLTDCIIRANTVADEGGGIHCQFNSASLTNVVISENTAYHGGAIYFGPMSAANLTNVTLGENSAHFGGGIYSESRATPSLVNATITGNTAGQSGGGVYCADSSSPSLSNCVLWNDTPEEIHFDHRYRSNTITIYYSDIQGDSAGIVTNDNGTVYWLEGNIDADPLFADTTNADFSLTQGSPCIDAGTPDTTGLSLPPWDILDNQRIWDGNGDEVAIIDMGAYEYGAPAVGIEPEVVIERRPRPFLRNYPNPFGSHTVIQYGMPDEAKVTLKVYNLLGQEIKVLADEFQDRGIHVVSWDGRDNHGQKVSSGTYFLRLEVTWPGFFRVYVEEFTATRKVCVVR